MNSDLKQLDVMMLIVSLWHMARVHVYLMLQCEWLARTRPGPDGGTELYLAVSSRKGDKEPVLLVAWGVEHNERRRREMLNTWAKRGEAYLDSL